MSKEPKPIIFPFTSKKDLNQVKKIEPHLTIIDQYQDQLMELFETKEPEFDGDKVQAKIFLKNEFDTDTYETTGNWVYFPWNKTLIHILDETHFQEVRLARNYPLISKEDQYKFLHMSVGVVGLSVGNSIVQALAYSGGANNLKLADPDTLSLSNLNRIKASLADLGQPKTHLAAKHVYEVNPYAQITLYSQGLTPDTIEDFFLGGDKLDLVFDEADEITAKHYIRLMARALRIPLIMTTDNGFESNTNVIRFDQDPNAGGMQGAPKLEVADIIDAYKHHEPLNLTEKEKLQLIVELVGLENVSPEMKQGSMLRAQKKIAGWPQVAMTVFLGGSMGAYAAKLIAIGAETPSKQTSFSIKKHLHPFHSTEQAQAKDKDLATAFKQFLESLH